MNTHALAAHLRNNRRPSHLGFSGEGLLNTVVDYGQEQGGEYIEEKVTGVTGSDTAGQLARTGFDAGVDRAQGQNQTPSAGAGAQTAFTNTPFILPFQPNLVNNYRAYQGLTPDRIKLIQSLTNSGLLQPTETTQQEFILDEELPEDKGELLDDVEPTESAEDSGKKKALIIGGSILALVLIGGGVYFATRK